MLEHRIMKNPSNRRGKQKASIKIKAKPLPTRKKNNAGNIGRPTLLNNAGVFRAKIKVRRR